MPASKTIGVIGLGSIGRRHAKNLLDMGHRVLGYDPLDAALHMMDERIEVIPDPLGKRRELAKMDGIVLSMDSKGHSVSILESGIHTPIFVEKPIGYNQGCLNLLQEIIPAIEAPFMVGNNLRFHSCVKKAKEWLTQGLIGKPLWASFCVAQHNTKYTDPVVLNWGAHEIDLALYLLGPATVTAAAGNDQIMDMCLLHEYGVPSTVHMDYVTKHSARGFTIHGDRGSMQVGLEHRHAILHGDNTDRHYDTKGSFDQDYKDEMQAFIDLIDGKPVPHAATGADGLHTLELILEAQKLAQMSADERIYKAYPAITIDPLDGTLKKL